MHFTRLGHGTHTSTLSLYLVGIRMGVVQNELQSTLLFRGDCHEIPNKGAAKAWPI